MTKLCPLMNMSKIIEDGQPVSAYRSCIKNSCEWYDDEYQQCAIKSIVKAIDNIDNTDYSNMIDDILASLNEINASIDSVNASVDSIDSCMDR